MGIGLSVSLHLDHLRSKDMEIILITTMMEIALVIILLGTFFIVRFFLRKRKIRLIATFAVNLVILPVSVRITDGKATKSQRIWLLMKL